MTSFDDLRRTAELIRLERQADLEYYRQKVLLRSLHQRTQEGTTWYPVRLRRDYIGTGERLIIELEKHTHLDQPHSFQSGKSVNVFCNASGKPEKQHTSGVVNYVRDNIMVITLNADELPDWIDDGQLGVDVMFDEMSYREMEYALKEVTKADQNRLAEMREILLGGKTPEPGTPLQTEASGLNESQRAALDLVTSTSAVAFVHGPPGTGKTTTLVAAIRQTVKNEGQVLVCAPSNAAVDLLVEKLDELGLFVVRIGHPARVTEQTLSKTLDSRITDHAHFSELKALRKRMERVKAQAHQFKRNFGHFEREQRRMMLDEAKALKADADLLEFHITNDLLQKADAICCTLVGSSHPVIRNRKFKTAFIDEAGQALEAACWIPALRSQRLIFAGDHQQLPPTIKSAEAARQGLSVTLFEKGIQRHPNLSAMLTVQYRMHEEIMAFSSSYFYQDRLRAHPSISKHLLRPHESPMAFIDTAGCGYEEKQDAETLSRFNEEEAHLVIHLAEKLIESVGAAEWIDEGISMGIITPYRAQVDHLHRIAEASPVLEPLHKLITINTVDAFQGQERDVILISLVRSNAKGEVGFLNDLRRTNVAMTRARKKLIVVGDSATLGSHPFYLSLIEHFQQRGYYQSAYEHIA